MATTVTLSALSDHLEQRAVSNRLVIRDQQFLDRLELAPYTDLVDGVLDEQPIISPTIGTGVVQRGRTGTFTPTGTINFADRTLKMRPMKTDILLTEDRIAAIETKYLGFVKKMAKAQNMAYDPENFSFADYIIEKMLTPRMVAETNLAMINGDYDNASTAPLNTMDGLLVLIKNAILDGSLVAPNLITGAGAITLSNAGDEFNKFETANVSKPELGTTKVYHFCAKQVRNLYRNRYRLDNAGQQGINKENIQLINAEENLPIIPIYGMAGSNRIIGIAEGNLFMCFDDSRFKIVADYNKRDRSLALVADWAIGLQFGVADQVFTNNYTGIN